MVKANISNIGLFAVTVIAQILCFAIIPRSAGFTDPVWTCATIACAAIGLGPLAYLIHTGVPLSGLIPILAATVPLATIFIGIVIYNEPASVMKIVLLILACCLIGVASAFE